MFRNVRYAVFVLSAGLLSGLHDLERKTADMAPDFKLQDLTARP